MTLVTLREPPGQESSLEALVRVRLVGGAEHETFEKYLRSAAAVVDAWRLAGDCDYEVRLRCRTLTGLDRAVGELRDAGGHTSTSLVLHRVSLDVNLDER
jgi:DNA-binding Lrp family transcriptional regulator